MAEPARLFLDFDGTLIDSRHRQHALFAELAPDIAMGFDAYWRIKRGRVNQADFLRGHGGYDDARIVAFHAAWMAKIEEPARLALDRPLPGVGDFLARAARLYPLYLVTARQASEGVTGQIHALGWTGHFTELLVTGQRASKAALMRAKNAGPADTIIGDTGEDIRAGQELGMRTIAVASGILAREILAEYKPDRLVEAITELELPLAP